MLRMVTVLALSLLLAACAGDGDVVRESDSDVTIRIGYDAAVKGLHPERLAAKHCAAYGKAAVWYGHDRDGNLRYKCE